VITFTKKIVLKLEDRRKGIYLRAREYDEHGLENICKAGDTTRPTPTLIPDPSSLFPSPVPPFIYTRYEYRDIFKPIRME
jgi:hypothetical protein